MKSLEITTNKKLLIVEAETDCEPKEGVKYYVTEDTEHLFILPKGLFKFICRGSNLTEEIADGFVDKGKNSYGEIVYANHYEDIGAFMGYEEALPSLISMIESLGWYWNNPLGSEPLMDEDKYKSEREFIDNNPSEFVFGDHYADWSMWKEAESLTFHPEKCLIFEIVENEI